MIYGLLLSNKPRFFNICVRAVKHFKSSRIDFWCFKDFKRYCNYKESKTQQGTCDKGEIIGINKSKKRAQNRLARTISKNLPTGKQNRRESFRILYRLIQEYFSKETPPV